MDASKATETALQTELDKVAKAYGGGAGIDMAAFPKLEFKDVEVDPINVAA